MDTYHTDSPVIFCIFNRPETTQRVFEQISKAQPPKLYIIADAPRIDYPDDIERCRKTRAIAENISWDCEVTLDYAETNLGCRERIFSGISNAFKKYDFAIILEDDCCPSNDFFRFVDTLRDRYSDDPRVTHISGTSFVRPKHPSACYYHSNAPLIWGWATWQRHWQCFDLSMPDWPATKQKLKRNAPQQSTPLDRLIRRIDHTYNGLINTWDYPYLVHTIEQHGHCISPTYNLVSNIGFGADSTLTSNAISPQSELPIDQLPIEITSPASTEINADCSNLQLINSLYRPRKIFRSAAQLCKFMKIPYAYQPKLAQPKTDNTSNDALLINLKDSREQ